MAEKKEPTVEELQKLLDTATADLKAATEMLTEHEAAATKGGETIAALKAEITQLQADNAEYKAAVVEGGKTIETVKAELAQLKADKAKLVSDAEGGADEIKVLKAKLAQFDADLKKSSADLAEAQNQPAAAAGETLVDVVAVQTIGIGPGKIAAPGTPLRLTAEDAAELFAAKAVMTPEAYAAAQAAKAASKKAVA